MGQGHFAVNLTVSGYLKDASLANAARAFQDAAMAFAIPDAAGNAYTFAIDRATFDDYSAPPDAKNKDVVLNYSLAAYGQNALRIIRTPAGS